MGTGLLHFHSFLPYIFIVLLIIVFVMHLIRWQSGKGVTKGTFTLAKVIFILAHIQLLVGILLLIFGDRGTAIWAQEGSMKLIMSDAGLRLSFIEHPITMILAIIVISMGYLKAKKLEGAARAKRIALFYGFGLVLILARIPWENWLN